MLPDLQLLILAVLLPLNQIMLKLSIQLAKKTILKRTFVIPHAALIASHISFPKTTIINSKNKIVSILITSIDDILL